MGEFNDFGLAHRTLAETLAERGRLVGFEKGQLLIERLSDGKLVGDVSWHAVSYGPGDRSKALNFGLSLIPDARGHGYGTEAQRLLAALLFRLFDIERIEASTDVESIAEQRSLEKGRIHPRRDPAPCPVARGRAPRSRQLFDPARGSLIGRGPGPAHVGIGWIDTNRPSQIIRFGAYRQGVKNFASSYG